MQETRPNKPDAARSDNLFIAEKLAEVADLLDAQGADPYRVRAYREASAFVAAMTESLRKILTEKGGRSLEDLPTIGTSIAGAIAELLRTGDLAMMRRLRGELDPEKVLQTVPTIGPRLAQVIHEDLGIETLEGLEVAAYDGRLETLNGIGKRRVRAIQHSLSEMLARRRFPRADGRMPAPPIEKVLDVDREYRRRVMADDLPKIAPRRFNPGGAAWLPILHTERGPWRLTALYSNTPNAHRLSRTRDWVVIYFEKDGTAEGQCTVVTETRGPFKGERVVRGHEPHRPAYGDQIRETGE
ncbi:helix-hairpin-helix domain-containing protein [Ovoidimarina sediminis]|uniref:helix-hairpin-helix domain-containing protein n=1 Tax=Ovoidimarina sediminis TaxID=3079856 RepID=UPI00291456C2|nr:helix-hairpin-helix domain-containing protein [Rhodophyticola sp. MJ-SS7]MDU8944196.1 helix-hairpin-helix domain-containing protein [Rhodophyticola sp. MJ-SS7]